MDPLPCPTTRYATSNSKPCSAHLRRVPQVRAGHPDNLRCFLHGLCIWYTRTSSSKNLPTHFDHWNSVFGRFRRWCQNRVWECLLVAVADERANLARVHLASSHMRCHIKAVGAADGAASTPSRTSWPTPPGDCYACA